MSLLEFMLRDLLPRRVVAGTVWPSVWRVNFSQCFLWIMTYWPMWLKHIPHVASEIMVIISFLTLRLQLKTWKPLCQRELTRHPLNGVSVWDLLGLLHLHGPVCSEHTGWLSSKYMNQDKNLCNVFLYLKYSHHFHSLRKLTNFDMKTSMLDLPGLDVANYPEIGKLGITF